MHQDVCDVHFNGKVISIDFINTVVNGPSKPNEPLRPIYGLFTLPAVDLDLDLDMDICPKNGYSNDRGTRYRSESESESVQ